jgi:ABC-2 type transport system ATP-binding protein
MSLGNKRKLAVVSAFMHNPDVYILDEPTSGLDPLMQEIFINYILGIKKQGKTVLLSTHIYHEVEALCDQVSIIKQGRIVSSIDMKEIKIRPQKIYKLEFLTKAGYDEFVSHKLNYQLKEPDKLQVRVIIEDNNINQFIRLLATTPIKFFSEDVYTLEDHFMHFYKKGDRS